ncbi:MAG: M50 family metallopeptidase [Myxococcaceae bacterium]|nr:M50 family metallopeptidase [Myxococcaceae bacterium]MCI0670495.1 M50 family metallopeptidase [Myxococcaceae bacterium]
MRDAPAFSFRFPLGPTPVLVEPSFWLVTALLGYRPGRPAKYLLAWVLVCFVSVLLHELGHATAARAFGSDTAIRLYSFGGLTFHRTLGRWQEVLVSLAGPFAGFLFGGVMWFLFRHSPPEGHFGQTLAVNLMWVNFGWGLINLMPVPPLDGGHVLLGLLGPRRRKLGYVLGMVAAGAVVALAWKLGQPFMAVMFALLGFQSFQAYQAERGA